MEKILSHSKGKSMKIPARNCIENKVPKWKSSHHTSLILHSVEAILVQSISSCKKSFKDYKRNFTGLHLHLMHLINTSDLISYELEIFLPQKVFRHFKWALFEFLFPSYLVQALCCALECVLEIAISLTIPYL